MAEEVARSDVLAGLVVDGDLDVATSVLERGVRSLLRQDGVHQREHHLPLALGAIVKCCVRRIDQAAIS